ncbi:MAG: methylated-DNA--[protein]-cysteine S-methyltransferase [Bacteroidota bacterium]
MKNTILNKKEKQVIHISKIETPLGEMCVCAVEEGICLLGFTDRNRLEVELETLAKTLNADVLQNDNEHIALLKKQLIEYFEGKREVFSIPLFTTGTEFQQLVWKELQNIPFGSTRSYKEQAISIGNLNAVRAVAHANSMNRISIIIPCHRVIGQDGALKGYSGGLSRKKWLLDFENLNLFNMK